MKALAIVALLQAPSSSPVPVEPATPLRLVLPRTFHGVEGAKLVDLSYDLEDGLSASHAFSAGVQFGSRAVARAWLRGDDRNFEIETARLRASVGQIGSETQGTVRVAAGRSSFDARAVFHRRILGDGGATLEGGWRRNLSDDVDAEVRLGGETRNVRFPSYDRARRFAEIGFGYQPSERFEAQISGVLRRLHTRGELEFDEADVRVRIAGAVRRGVYDLSARSISRSGKYEVRDTSVAFETAVPLAARLVVEASGDARHEHGGGVREHRARGALTWFVRRARLSRTGPSAKRAFDLSRAATRGSFIERAQFDGTRETSHRDLRQRAALLPQRAELRAAVEELFAAEFDDRDVPLLGVSYETATRRLTGETSRAFGANVSLPWPARLSPRSSDAATRFLRLDVSRVRTEYGVGLVSIVRTAEVTAELNREIALRTSLGRSDPNPLERVRGYGAYTTFEVGARYTFAR
jgi:hypothetical protein